MANHPNRGRQPRPRQHVAAIGKRYPDAWRQVDDFRADRGRGLPDWPDWCFLPLAGAYAIVSGGGDNRVGPALAGDVGRLGAVAAWRVSQGIYRYDPALYEALIETPVTGDLPCDVIYRLPEWCVYLETPDLTWNGDALHGAFGHLEWDANSGREELRLVLDTATGLIPIPMHLGAWTLDKALARMIDTAQVWATASGITLPTSGRDALRQTVEPIVSLLLYLCSSNADLPARPERPRPKRTKAGWRLFPADKATTWDVGERIGAALRRAYQQSETDQRAIDPQTGRARPRAHVRRAHWHTYLTGAGRQTRTLKWIPPIAVNVDDVDDLPATVRPVR
jgi:hypothetical protein